MIVRPVLSLMLMLMLVGSEGVRVVMRVLMFMLMAVDMDVPLACVTPS